MAGKSNQIEALTLEEISASLKDLTLDTLLSKLPKNKKKAMGFTPTQIVAVLKITELTGNASETARMTGVSRSGIMKWMKMYGTQVFAEGRKEASPAVVSYEVQKIETDLATKKAKYIGNVYEAINDQLEMIGKTARNLTGRHVKDLYPLAESLKATAELIKIEKTISAPPAAGEKGTNFFMHVHNMMIKNAYPDGNNS